MNNKITNPLLKQLISEIAGKSKEGRMNISWGALKESNNFVKKEADEKDKENKKDAPADKEGNDSIEGLPPLEGPKTDSPDRSGPDKAGKEAPKAEPAAPDAEKSVGDDSGEESEKAQADAVKAKAELEKAKAEKDQAEKELKKHSYVKLQSSGGLQFMLGKILNSAFKTNTVDALASEMVQKLKISTPEDATAFEEDMAMYKNIPGMVDLLSSIKGMAVKQPEAPTEEEPAD
jgi:hypothetical protein